jgi:hypothetical protein
MGFCSGGASKKVIAGYFTDQAGLRGNQNFVVDQA